MQNTSIFLYWSNSSGVASIPVDIVSQNGNVLAVSPSNCMLSSLVESCSITLTGVESGTTTVIASASGYEAFTTNTITVNSVPQTGSLSIMVNPSTIVSGESAVATLQLNNSVGVTNQLISISSQTSNVVTVTPNSCELSSITQSCTVNIVGVESGNTILTASGGEYLASSNTINVVAPVQPGTLAVVVNPANITTGEIAMATISLSNSSGVLGQLITLSSQDMSVLTVASLNSCTLSSISNICYIELTGIGTGSSTVTASGGRYASTSNAITVNSPIESGMLSISLADNTLSGYESTVATITLNNAYGITNLRVGITSLESSIATVSSDSCIIVSYESGQNSCLVTVNSVSLESGSTIIQASNPDYILAQTILTLERSPLLSWQAFGESLSIANATLSSIAIANNGTVYVGGAADVNNGFVKYNVSGGAWQVLGGGYIPNSTRQTVQVDDIAISSSNIVYVAASVNHQSSNLFSNSGGTWGGIPQSSDLQSNGPVVSIALDNNSMLYQGLAVYNLMTSQYFGYLYKSNTSYGICNSTTGKVSSLVLSESGIVYVAYVNYDNHANTNSGNVYRINGASCILIGGGSMPDGGVPNAIAVLNGMVSNTVYVGTSKGNIYSAMGTNSWVHITGQSLPDNGRVTALTLSAVGVLYVATANGNIYGYTGSGNWQLIGGSKIPDGWVINDIATFQNMVYAVTQGGNVYVVTSLLQ